MDIVPSLVAHSALARHAAKHSAAIVQMDLAHRRVATLREAGVALRSWVQDRNMLADDASAYGAYVRCPHPHGAPPTGSDAPCVIQLMLLNLCNSRPLRLTPVPLRAAAQVPSGPDARSVASPRRAPCVRGELAALWRLCSGSSTATPGDAGVGCAGDGARPAGGGIFHVRAAAHRFLSCVPSAPF